VTPASEDMTIEIYPAAILQPLPVPERTEMGADGLRRIRNVSRPALEIFRAEQANPSGSAVIVLPGGGFAMLAYDSEGTLVAKRLAQEGITAFVLKYRTKATAEDPAAFKAELQAMMYEARLAAAATGGRTPQDEAEIRALEDAAQALRVVRSRAVEWGLNDVRIGVLGFSAGAAVATGLAIGEAATRPNFVGILYGPVRGPVPPDAPPAFIAAAADDPLLGEAAEPLFDAWKAVHRPAELHIYQRGGHAFGLVAQGSSSDRWIEQFLYWLDANGLRARQGSVPAVIGSARESGRQRALGNREMAMNSGYGHYVLKETLISALVSGTLSAVAAWLVFGGQREVGIWGQPGLAFDFIPQTFIASLLSVIIPSLITRVRSRSGALQAVTNGSWLPRNLLLRAVLIAAVLTLLLGGGAIAMVAAYKLPVPIGAVYAIKIAYGALVALVATPVALFSYTPSRRVACCRRGA